MDDFDTNFFIQEGDGPNDLYKQSLQGVLAAGEEASPRGALVKEVSPAMVVFLNPRERFLTQPGRLIHPVFQIMESIWILGGRGDTEFIKYYLKNMEKYSDNREEFNAPYGVRMRRYGRHRDESFPIKVMDQFQNCFLYLMRDPETRHACMSFWSPFYDSLFQQTNDRPCNIFFQFLIRKGVLNLYVFNRSNDVNLGLFNTNVVQFSVILETMWVLLKEAYPDLRLGVQTHLISNLHVYDYQGEITERVLESNYEFNVYDYVQPAPFRASFPRFLKMEEELRAFFWLESSIRKGLFREETVMDSFPGLTFNFLADALLVALSFFYFKTNDFRRNLSLGKSALARIEADDIFITCAEFFARDKFFLDSICSFARERFAQKGFSEENILTIINYIESH